MSRYTEEQLIRFTAPISDSENQRCENIIGIVKDAIRDYGLKNNIAYLSLDNYEIFLQGSYANNTNVRQNSDVDICVMYHPVFSYEGQYTSIGGGASFTYQQLKKLIYDALVSKFGSNRVEFKNKSIRILSNTYTVDADVVPAFMHKNFIISSKYVEGIAYWTSNDNCRIINYPKIHKVNGTNKNNSTNYMYKKMARIFKKIMYDMQNDNISASKDIKGFAVECMIYNIPNHYFTSVANSYSERLNSCLNYLVTNPIANFKEVNEIKPLFGTEKSDTVYKMFLTAMKEYIR